MKLLSKPCGRKINPQITLLPFYKNENLNYFGAIKQEYIKIIILILNIV